MVGVGYFLSSDENCFFRNCRPVYPEEEADDSNVVDDNQNAELDLDKPDEDAIMVYCSLLSCSLVKSDQCGPRSFLDVAQRF